MIGVIISEKKSITYYISVKSIILEIKLIIASVGVKLGITIKASKSVAIISALLFSDEEEE